MLRYRLLICLLLIFVTACAPIASDRTDPQSVDSAEVSTGAQEAGERSDDEVGEHDHEGETEHREHGAHVHGAAALMIAWSGNEMAIDLESPAYNILGFEYAPTSDEERALFDERVAALEAGGLLLINPAAECAVVSADVRTALSGETDGEEHEHSEHEAGEEGHAEDGHEEDGHAEEGHAEDSHAEDSHAEDGHEEEGHAEEGHAEDSHAEEGHAEDGHAEEGHAEDGHAEEGHAEEGHAEDSHAKDDHEDGHDEDGHAKDDHDEDGHADETHSDIDVAYNLTCQQPENIASLDAGAFFAQFPNFEEIEVQWVSDTQQSAGELTPENPVLSFE